MYMEGMWPHSWSAKVQVYYMYVMYPHVRILKKPPENTSGDQTVAYVHSTHKDQMHKSCNNVHNP